MSSSTEGVSATYVFNQYYWDFLKKVKENAKKQKDNSRTARNVLRNIKKNYMSFDKMSPDHMAFFREHAIDAWNEYISLDSIEKTVAYFQKSTHAHEDADTENTERAILIYKDEISLEQIAKLLESESILVHQYFTLFGLLCDESTDVNTLLQLMKQFKLDDDLLGKLKALPEGKLQSSLIRLYNVFEHLLPSKNLFAELESTTLGKLAKEIMDDINIDELQNSVQPDMLQGNIMDIFTKQDGGLSKIISSVSQKMVSKMASGEIQQEDLLKDALSVASKLPGLMPGGMGGELGKMGEMLSQMTGGGSSSGGGFDISSLMNMMGGLGGLGGAKPSKKAMHNPGKTAMAKQRINSEMKRQKVLNKMRQQLNDKKKNVDGQIEDTDS